MELIFDTDKVNGSTVNTYISSHNYKVEITLHTVTGYMFNNAVFTNVYYHHRNGNTGYYSVEGILSDNNTTWTGTIYTYNTSDYVGFDIADLIVTSAYIVSVVNNIANTNETHNITNNVLTIEIVGNLENYKFTTIPAATYINQLNETETVNFAVTYENNKATATVTITNYNTNQNIIVTVSGVYEQYINIINNINDTTETHTFTSNDINLTVTTNYNYYKFNSLYVTYTDTNNIEVTRNLTLNQKENVGTITLTNVNYNANVNVYGAIVLNVNIVNNIDNQNTQLNYDLINDDLHISLTGLLTDYEFYDPKVIFDNTEIDGVINENTAIFIVENADLTKTYTITGKYLYTITVEYVINNCIVTPLNLKVNNSTVITITATPNEYFIFEKQPYLRLKTITGYQDINFVDGELTFDFSTVENFENLTHIIVYSNAIVDNSVIDKYGSVYLYIVSNENLTDFAKIRFETVTSGGTSREIDKGIYIKSLKRIYLNNIFTVDNNIRLGNYVTDIIAKSVINDTITLNPGNIIIPSYSNNATDFQNEYNLFLPFYGFYKIDNSFVGKTLNVEYICNLINGLAIITLKADNYIIDKLECNITTDILYETTDKTQVRTVGNITNNIANLKGLEPYLNVKYYTDLNQNIYNSDCKHDKVKNFSGFIKCKEIFFNNPNLKNVEELIKNELENGIIV